MATVDEHRRGRAPGRGWPRGAGIDLGTALLLTIATAAASWRVLALHASHVPVATALCLLLAALILRGSPPELRANGLGAANRITLGRAVLAMPVLALSLHPVTFDDGVRWWIIGISTVVMVFDGV